MLSESELRKKIRTLGREVFSGASFRDYNEFLRLERIHKEEGLEINYGRLLYVGWQFGKIGGINPQVIYHCLQNMNGPITMHCEENWPYPDIVISRNESQHEFTVDPSLCV